MLNTSVSCSKYNKLSHSVGEPPLSFPVFGIGLSMVVGGAERHGSKVFSSTIASKEH